MFATTLLRMIDKINRAWGVRMGIQSKPTLTSPVYRVMQATARGHKTDDPSAQDPKLQVSEKTNAMRPFVLASL